MSENKLAEAIQRACDTINSQISERLKLNQWYLVIVLGMTTIYVNFLANYHIRGPQVLFQLLPLIVFVISGYFIVNSSIKIHEIKSDIDKFELLAFDYSIVNVQEINSSSLDKFRDTLQKIYSSLDNHASIRYANMGLRSLLWSCIMALISIFFKFPN